MLAECSSKFIDQTACPFGISWWWCWDSSLLPGDWAAWVSAIGSWASAVATAIAIFASAMVALLVVRYQRDSQAYTDGKKACVIATQCAERAHTAYQRLKNVADLNRAKSDDDIREGLLEPLRSAYEWVNIFLKDVPEPMLVGYLRLHDGMREMLRIFQAELKDPNPIVDGESGEGWANHVASRLAGRYEERIGQAAINLTLQAFPKVRRPGSFWDALRDLLAELFSKRKTAATAAA